ncbi:DNA internalization-related competence protein ComEC/Rec2 [Simplicispira psychrophila]|uniref:DNA internalization-related competence protein ComEC/Rec2 n=1 Tax=Simplicispira psychrophila TaxID=80882 RepID=UPI000A034F51|nr:DNA internalization-related competence protein ComEC/Rec2 [Simplicispira psychrophila]
MDISAPAQPTLDFALAPPRSSALVPLLLGVLLGTALQVRQPVLWSLALYALLGLGSAAALGALWCWGRRRRGVGIAVVLAAAGLLFAVCGLRASDFAAQALSPALEGRDVRITGVIAAMPQPIEGGGVRLRLAVEAAQLDGRAVQLPPLIDLGWYAGDWREGSRASAVTQPPGAVPALRAGERWRLTARLKAPHGERNPHGFDYELWLWGQGVQGVGYVRVGAHDIAPQRLDTTWRYPIEQARQSVRDAILNRLASDPTDATAVRIAGVVAALVTGDQRAIDRSDWDVFRATGVAHLMSISGLHITLFAWVAALLVRWLWRRSERLCLRWPAPSAALVGGVLLALAYALFSGWGVPAQRTVAMLGTAALLRLSGRRWPWPPAWLLTCAVVVLPDPWALWQAGFWLSFVAVAVLFATDKGASSAGSKGVRGHFMSLLREQGVVTLALTPLTLLLFGQVSLVGLLANLLAIPWVTLVVTPLAFAGVLWAPLWHLAGWAVQGMAVWLQWLAALPLASVWVAAAPLWAGLAGVAGGVLLAMRLPWSVRLLGLPLLLPVLLWQAPRPPPGQFELLAADVGQGNAVLVRTATHTLLYDTGPRYSAHSDAGGRVLVPLLRALDARVDVLMLSHRDSDHTGGAAAVLAQQPQAQLMGSIEGEHHLQTLHPVQPCLAGQQWQWDGVDFAVLHPLPGEGGGAERAHNPNTQSCVLRIASGRGAVALLVGDIEKAQEQALLDRQAALAADVLLVPHHGSKTSSSGAFLDAVQPRAALVQAAYRSRFGHPAAQVMQRYRERGIAVWDSAHCGAATWQSAQPAQVRCERAQQQRYWQHRIEP